MSVTATSEEKIASRIKCRRYDELCDCAACVEDRQRVKTSQVRSRHVLTEGYAILYTDGSHVMCGWGVAP